MPSLLRLARQLRPTTTLTVALALGASLSGAGVALLAHAFEPIVYETREAESLDVDAWWTNQSPDAYVLARIQLDAHATDRMAWPDVHGARVPEEDYDLDETAREIRFAQSAAVPTTWRLALLVENARGERQLHLVPGTTFAHAETKPDPHTPDAHAYGFIQATLRLTPTPDALRLTPVGDAACAMTAQRPDATHAQEDATRDVPPRFQYDLRPGESLALRFTGAHAPGHAARHSECEPLGITLRNEGIWSR